MACFPNKRFNSRSGTRSRSQLMKGRDILGGLLLMRQFQKLLGVTFFCVMLSAWVCGYFVSDSSGETNAGKEVESVEEIIMSLERGAMERWRNRDPWGWAEISAEEIIYIDPGLTKPIEGLEEYKKYLKQFEGKIHYQISEFIDPKIVTCGNCVVLTYNYRSAETNSDDSIISQTLWNSTEVYCLLEGEWQIIHTHWSYIEQKPPERTEVPVSVDLKKMEYEGVLGEVMALESAAMERWRRGDPGGFTDISAPGVTYFDTGTPKRLDGLDALKAEYETRVGKIHYDVMEFIDPSVQVHGDAAVLTYRFFSTRIHANGSIASRTPWNCTEVFSKVDGEWRIIHTHWSFINGKRM